MSQPYHLESWLDRLKVSKRALAGELKTTAQSISNWTRGKNASWPQVGLFLWFAEKAGVPGLGPDYFEDCWLFTRRWWLENHADEEEKERGIAALEELEKTRPLGDPPEERAVERQVVNQIQALEKRPGIYSGEEDDLAASFDLSFEAHGQSPATGTSLPDRIQPLDKTPDAYTKGK